jgi:hypothetical protein
VSVAQQVEQKETMAIQYTIELRKMLNDMPVRDEIREFLFKVWAEVLAIAALRYGPQGERPSLKKSLPTWCGPRAPSPTAPTAPGDPGPAAAAAAPAPGMTLLGMSTSRRKRTSRSSATRWPTPSCRRPRPSRRRKIEAMTERLANLEDFVSDDGRGRRLPLDAHSIEMMLGIDAA